MASARVQNVGFVTDGTGMFKYGRLVAPGIPHHENRPRPPRESRGRKSRHLIWNRVGAGSSDEQIESAVAVPVGKAQFPASGVPGESSAHRNQGSVREPELPAAFKIEVIDLPVEVKMIVAV